MIRDHTKQSVAIHYFWWCEEPRTVECLEIVIRSDPFRTRSGKSKSRITVLDIDRRSRPLSKRTVFICQLNPSAPRFPSVPWIRSSKSWKEETYSRLLLPRSNRLKDSATLPIIVPLHLNKCNIGLSEVTFVVGVVGEEITVTVGVTVTNTEVTSMVVVVGIGMMVEVTVLGLVGV